MKTSVLTLALLSGSALAAQLQFRSTYHDFGAMLRRGDAIARRQGYTPSTRDCGSGDNCEEACGKNQVQCDSNVGLFCHDSTDGSFCCPDRSGNSCSKDYVCTHDKVGATYCCPEGEDLKECAKSYSVDALSKQTAVPVPTETASPTAAPVTDMFSAADPKSIYSTFVNPSTYPTPVGPKSTATRASSAPSSATAPASEFTGAAGKVAGAGMAVLAAGAGLFL